ncbi:killer cell lectin-like receptor subfamily B member 1F isoform X3 [Arvicanthis niloticus]|uniref:killer cell lectin-like receptor subfamily B member 1F isoform X3 n=1 Tax=Arvicanthis niloticus TaxID=61156 RepID=UPI00402B50B3
MTDQLYSGLGTELRICHCSQFPFSVYNGHIKSLQQCKTFRSPGYKQASSPCLPPVRFLAQKSPICSVAAQENRTGLTGRSAILECPRHWHQHWNKCLFISQISKPWTEGLAACSIKDATSLHIESKEELRFVQNFIKGKEQLFFIGLNYVQEEKIWKWINGSILNPNL